MFTQRVRTRHVITTFILLDRSIALNVGICETSRIIPRLIPLGRDEYSFLSIMIEQRRRDLLRHHLHQLLRRALL